MASLSGDGDDATLSKRLDPMSDENFKQLVSVENRVNSLEMKVSKISKEITVITSGDLGKSPHQDQEAVKSIQKRGKRLRPKATKPAKLCYTKRLMLRNLSWKIDRFMS